MLEEDTWGSRHGEKISVCGKSVFSQWVLGCIGTLFCVVVLHKGNSPLAVDTTIEIAANQRPIAIVLQSQFTPIAIVGGIANSIAELEIEGRAFL